MRQGTTPSYTLTVSGYDLTDKTVYVAIRARNKLLTLTGERLAIGYTEGVSAVVFTLTQKETLAMAVGTADVQIRFIDAAGNAKATDIQPITIRSILQPGEIAYDGGDSNA